MTRGGVLILVHIFFCHENCLTKLGMVDSDLECNILHIWQPTLGFNKITNLRGLDVGPLVSVDGLRYVVGNPLVTLGVLIEDAGAPDGRVDARHVAVGLEVAEAGDSQVLVVARSEVGLDQFSDS